MEEFFNSLLGKILRWLLFLPLSFLGYFLSVLILGLVMYLTMTPYHFEETLWSALLRSTIVNGLGGFSFVFIGCYIVPNYRKLISIILAVIFIVFSGLFMFGSISMGNMFASGQFEGWRGIISIIAAMIGAGYASYNILHDEYIELY